MSEITNRQILDGLDDPVIVLDESAAIRRGNDAAHQLLPGLADAIGVSLESAFPELAGVFGDGEGNDDGPEVISVERGGQVRHLVPDATPLAVGPRRVGWSLVLRDVTAVERQRRELARQNEQMDQFAAAIAHELRNTLAVATGNLGVADDAVSAGDLEEAADAVESAVDAAERMIDVVDDLNMVAQYSRSVEDVDRIEFGTAVASTWDSLDLAVDLEVTLDGTITADPARFGELMRNAARLAAGTDASNFRTGLTDDGFTFLTDGDPVPGENVDRALEYGTSVPSAETGMLLPNVWTLARAHGWDVEVDPDYDHGIRVVVSGATTDPEEAPGFFG
jgi:signal transduction histidine kinase